MVEYVAASLSAPVVGQVAVRIDWSDALCAVAALAIGFVAALVRTCRDARATGADPRFVLLRRRSRPLALRPEQRRGHGVNWRVTYLGLLLVASACSVAPALAQGQPLTVGSALSTVDIIGGVAMTPATPVTASGGTTPYDFSISPPLPSGLSIDSATGTISGTPAAVSNSTSQIYLVTVTDAASGSAGVTFTLGIGNASTPTISSIAPSYGPTTGGTAITITGTNFGNGGTLKINGLNVAYTFVNSTTITATTQANAAGAVPVAYSSVLGDAVTNVKFTYEAIAPVITSVTPNNGPVGGGTAVTISGTGFTGATAVKFGGTAAASFSVGGNNLISAVSPPGSAGLVDVTVTTPVGTSTTSTSDQFAYAASFPTATLTGTVSPSTYSAAGQALTYTFTFQNTGTNPVRLSPTSASSTGMDATSLLQCFNAYASTPLAAGQSVTCQNIYTTVASDVTPPRSLFEGMAITATDTVTLGSQPFDSPQPTVTYAGSAPTVTAISPNTGSTSGGSSVTITGTGFTGATAVTIGGVAATGVSVLSATSVTAITPAHAAGTADVVVTAPGGTGTGAGLYTYAAASPTIATISPVNGSTAGGGTATITGTNLSGITSITIGGVAATGVQPISSTSVTFFLPAHAAGAVDVTVVTPQGSATRAGFYTYVVPLTLAATASAVTQAGVAYSQANVATNGTAPYAYSLAGGSLPAGVTLNTSTGLVSGTPTTAGAFSYTIRATDSSSQFMSATQTVSGTIAPAGPVATTTTLSSSVNPAALGQSVTFTATVASSGVTPTGTVTFLDGPTTLGTATLAGGRAMFSTSSLSTGNHPITASYGGDANSLTSASAALSQAVNLVSATAITLASSANPVEAGKPVTFTATVTSSRGTPTGTVSFSDGSTVIGTAALAAGAASFTTSSLAVGSHTIVASYGGAATFAASTSSALTLAVNTSQDSLRLRALQIIATTTVAQNSGAAISGAIDTAISDGFAEGGNPITPGGGGIRFNFSADPDESRAAGVGASASDRWSGSYGRGDDGHGLPGGSSSNYASSPQSTSRVDDAFAAIDRKAMPAKASLSRFAKPKDWLLWADVRGSGIDRWSSSTTAPILYGNQVNALMGLTRKFTPNFLIGAVGGYEVFDYRSDALAGHLTGGGWTLGSYLGWKFAPGLRFDAAAAYSGIGYDGSAGTASGSFSGHRWLVSSGVTGTYRAYGLDIEPSAKIYALWENENAFTDSLGTLQADRNFFTGRASGGVKVSYPWLYSATMTLSPYAGLYADYYFTGDDAANVVPAGVKPLASIPLLQGWSARATGGLAARFGNGAAVAVGAELGGIGGNVETWTFRGRASVPF